jgi:phage terminase large subunit
MEIEEYTWRFANKEQTDKPIDAYNHALDAIRYSEQYHQKAIPSSKPIERTGRQYIREF